MAQDDNPQDDEKQRRDEHFERQKALLASGDYSDLKITCGTSTWNVHKAIVCPSSGFFARAVKFGKEQADNSIDLPHDDPKIIKLLLDYLYTLDYDARDALDKPRTKSHRESFFFAWSDHDDLSRTDRRKLQEGLYKLNDAAMAEGLAVTKEEYPNLSPWIGIHVWSNTITPTYLSRILTLLANPTNHAGRKFFAREWADSGEVHARLYCLADKYDVAGLRELAFARLAARVREWSLGETVVVKALDVLMKNTPEEDKRARELVVECLERDMQRFGRRACNRGFFERYPELYEEYLRRQFGEEDKDEEVGEEDDDEDDEDEEEEEEEDEEENAEENAEENGEENGEEDRDGGEEA